MKRLIIVIGILAISTSAFGWGFGPGGGGASSIAQLSDWPAAVSATEVGYLDGVTDTLINLLAAKSATTHNHDASYLAIGGNATTASALAADPAGCAGGQVTNDINASGVSSCTSWSANVLSILGAANYSAILDLLFPAVASPTALYNDSDAPGADKEIAKTVGAYVDGADGAENGTYSIFAHEGGTSTEYIQVDGKNTDVEFKKVVVFEAGSKVQDPIVDSDGLTMAAPGINGGTYIASGAGTWAHSTAIASGENWSLEAHSAAAVVLTINASDTLWLNGTAQAQGVGLTSDSTVNAFVACQYKAANTITCRGVSFTATP